MAMEKMVLLNLKFRHEDLYDVLFLLNDFKDFHPQLASKIAKNIKSLEKDNAYYQLKKYLIEIASEIKLELNEKFDYEYSLNVHKTNNQLHELEKEILKIKDILNQLVIEKEENEKTLMILKHLDLMRVNIDQLQECRYLSTKFGRIKRQNLNKIQYYDDQPYLFYQLGVDNQYILCCYMTTGNVKLKVDNIFSALGFEEIKLPSFVHGTFKEAKKELEDEIRAMDEYILRMNQKMTVLRESQKIDLLKIYSTLSFLCHIEEYKDFVVDYQSKYAIYGFIPQFMIDKLKEQMKGIQDIDYQELPMNLLEDHQIEAPLIINNAKIVKPFELISHVTLSDKIDTTIAYAVLHYVVFMIFLGDLGVGAVMTLLGLLMRKKKMGTLILSLGIATMLGGLLYGNVFYIMHLYRAMTLPLSTVYRIIDGIVLLIVGMVTIRTFVKMNKENTIVEKCFSLRGICGLIVLYSCIVYLVCVYEGAFPLPMTPLAIVIVACLILILMKTIVKKRLVK